MGQAAQELRFLAGSWGAGKCQPLLLASCQVKKVHFDTQEHGPKAIPGLEPKAVPLLLQQQDRGSPERENACYVSSAW